VYFFWVLKSFNVNLRVECLHCPKHLSLQPQFQIHRNNTLRIRRVLDEVIENITKVFAS